jgi:hypothetical protein
MPDWVFWYFLVLISGFFLVAAVGSYFDRKARRIYARRLDTFDRHLRQLSDVDTYIQTRGGRI